MTWSYQAGSWDTDRRYPDESESLKSYWMCPRCGIKSPLSMRCATCDISMNEIVRIPTRNEPYKRPDWDEYFLNIATVVATRSGCGRARVGAVIVNDRRIVGTGYNGTPRGVRGCLDGGCPAADSSISPLPPCGYGPGDCVAIHAPANALLFADRADYLRSTIYITREPCNGCLNLIAGAGIILAIWPDGNWMAPL